ncbi:MAG: SDR family NAD(P)-dependent oxidoreductase [Nitrospinota bacterium]|nr:SDR family NAD(P)-dependent oxidoreductase [Nitrospinota bacterium]
MSDFLVTGTSGFIGSRVSEILLQEGHLVVGIDNLNNSYDNRLKKWRLKQLKTFSNFIYEEIDIYDHKILDKFVSKTKKNFEAIINLAAHAGVRKSVENPRIYYETNVLGTLNLLELCKKFEIGKFVLASSSSIYGESDIIPFSEKSDTDIFLSPYAASKKSAEDLCKTYNYLFGTDISILRFFTVYGPAGRPDMSIFRFIKWIIEGDPIQIYGDGQQKRDFTFVDDIAKGTISSLRRVGLETFNLGSDNPIKLLDVISIIEQETGMKANLEFKDKFESDVFATWANIKKAKEILNWVPKTSFMDGIKKVVAWHLQNKEFVRQIKI